MRPRRKNCVCAAITGSPAAQFQAVRWQRGQGRHTVVIRFNHIAPHLYTADLQRSRAFYERILGFSLDYSDGEPPHYMVLCRDDVYIHLSHTAPLGVPQHPGAAFLAVADIDSLWGHVSAQPGCVVAQLADADYGGGVRFRVFTVRDPDGNVLRIGEPRSGLPPN